MHIKLSMTVNIINMRIGRACVSTATVTLTITSGTLFKVRCNAAIDLGMKD